MCSALSTLCTDICICIYRQISLGYGNDYAGAFYFIFILLSGPCGASGDGCADRFSLVGVRSAQDTSTLIPHIENLIDMVMGMGILFMNMYLWADGSWMDGWSGTAGVPGSV